MVAIAVIVSVVVLLLHLLLLLPLKHFISNNNITDSTLMSVCGVRGYDRN